MGFQNDGSAIVKLAMVLLWTLVIGAIIFGVIKMQWDENARLEYQLEQANTGATQVALQLSGSRAEGTRSAEAYARQHAEVMVTATHQAKVATWQDGEMQKLYAVNVTQAAQLTAQAQEIAAVRTAAAVTIANLPQAPGGMGGQASATPAAPKPGDGKAPSAPAPTATPTVGMNPRAVIDIDPNVVALILIGLSLVGIPVLVLFGALIYKRSRRQG